MKWSEVRRIYPDQFVKLEILEYHMVDNKKYIDEVAVIRALENNKEATHEFVRAKENILVYHTGNDEIVVEVRNIKGYRGIG